MYKMTIIMAVIDQAGVKHQGRARVMTNSPRGCVTSTGELSESICR